MDTLVRTRYVALYIVEFAHCLNLFGPQITIAYIGTGADMGESDKYASREIFHYYCIIVNIPYKCFKKSFSCIIPLNIAREISLQLPLQQGRILFTIGHVVRTCYARDGQSIVAMEFNRFAWKFFMDGGTVPSKVMLDYFFFVFLNIYN